MRRECSIGVLMAALTATALHTWGQAAGGGGGAGRGTTPPAATAPGTLAVKNIEKQLENPVTIDAEKTNLGEFISALRRITQTNITVNWNALAAAGLSRETPIALHLKDVPYEHVVKTLIDILPVKGDGVGGGGDPSLRLNYTVGDNTLSITTNAELGKRALPKIFPIARPMMLEGVTVDEKLAESIVRAELVRAGEPMDAPGHAVAMRGDTLAAAVSERGYMLISKLQAAFAAPTRPGQMPAGIAQTATAKRGQEALVRAAGGAARVTNGLFLQMARDPAKYRTMGLNLAFIAGTEEELAKPAPDIAGTVNDGGVVLIGPRPALAARTVFAAYDLRDVLRRQAAAGGGGAGRARGAPAAPSADVLDKVIEGLKAKVDVEWASLAGGGRTPTAMVPYGTVLVVFAPADVQRRVTAALQELAR